MEPTTRVRANMVVETMSGVRAMWSVQPISEVRAIQEVKPKKGASVKIVVEEL